MAPAPLPFRRVQPGLAFILLVMLLGAVWLAGGASRADVLGQAVVRSVAWITLILFVLLGNQTSPIARPVAWFLLAALALPLLQLVPLPPDVWQSLPGRAPLSEAATASGQAQPWRPLSIVPEATLNAVYSLVVPFAVLLLATGLQENEWRWMPGLLLILMLLASLLALLQFSGARFDNPFINETIGKASGSFANRNHFALFMALGCLIAPVWAFTSGGSPGWRGPVAVGLLLFFTLTILASGSRAGLLTGPLGVVIGLGLARSGIRRALSRHPRWMTWGLIAGVIAATTAAVLLSVAAGRATSIYRAFALDEAQDLRFRGLPTVLEMTREYFPFGSGIGTFDGVFRMHEPLDLLAPTYFNHAHNDWLEIVLDAGLPGALLLLAAVGWWAWASVQAWWTKRDRHDPMPRLGSAMLLLIMISSAFDYPARTPMIMAMIVIAGIWLDSRAEPPVSSALRTPKQHL